jgi:hypothetical protein
MKDESEERNQNAEAQWRGGVIGRIEFITMLSCLILVLCNSITRSLYAYVFHLSPSGASVTFVVNPFSAARRGQLLRAGAPWR